MIQMSKAWRWHGTCATDMPRSYSGICNSSIDKTGKSKWSFKNDCFQHVAVKKFQRSVKVCNCRRKQLQILRSVAPDMPSVQEGLFLKHNQKKSEALVVTSFLSRSSNVILFLVNTKYWVLTLVVKTYFFCFHMQSVLFFLGQENANLSVKSVLKEIQGQVVVVGRVGRKTKEEDCGFVTHLPGPWISVLLPRAALC